MESIHRQPDKTPQARRSVRVLVTGSRDWTDCSAVYEALDALGGRASVTVVHGACPGGADNWARAWVQMRRQTEEPHPADWKRHGKKAGFIRNTEMARLGADLCLAFIRNLSNGATHCAREAVSFGIPTVTFRQQYPDLRQVADALALSGASEGSDT